MQHFKLSFTIFAIVTFTELSTFFTCIKTLTVFFHTSCLFTITSFKCGSFLSISDSGSVNHFIDGFSSYFTVFFSILTTVTIAINTEGSYILIEDNLPWAKHSQYSFRHLDFLQLHLVCVDDGV